MFKHFIWESLETILQKIYKNNMANNGEWNNSNCTDIKLNGENVMN